MNFTPVESFTGGLLIGTSVVILYRCCGKYAGISGIAAQLLQRAVPGRAVAFVLGLPLGGLLFRQAAGSPEQEISASMPRLLAAGLLVGVGTRLGSGCTSGHGICGLGRFSLRSLAATAIFMAVGMLTVFVTGRMRYCPEKPSSRLPSPAYSSASVSACPAWPIPERFCPFSILPAPGIPVWPL